MTVPPPPIATQATNVTNTQFFVNWQPSNGATGYVFDLCMDIDFSNCLYQNQSTNSGTGYTGNPFGSILIYNIPTTRDYYYRIRAVNNSGLASVSSNVIKVEKFPSVPIAAGPTNITKYSFTANWSNVPEASDYVLEISTDNTFANLYSSVTASGTSFTLTGLSPGVALYYREMFLNEVEVTKLTAATTPEYQYFIKDHLGNVRVTFTANDQEDRQAQSLATLEALRAPQEEGEFIYYDEAVKVNAKIFDHSDQQGGAEEEPPLQGEIKIHVEAENFTSQSGTSVTGSTVGYCDNNDWLQYNGINLTGITSLKIHAAAAQNVGRVEVRVGSTTGQLLGYMHGTNTGSWETYSTFTVPLTAPTGLQNIVLLFKDGEGVMNIDWLEFTGPGPNGLPVKAITLQNTSLALSVGQTARLIKMIIPAEATNQTVNWASNNTAVATVNSSGVVTANAIGTAMITVTTASGNHQAKAVIQVKPASANMLTNSEFDSGTLPWELGDWTGPNYTPTEGNSISAPTVSGFSGTKALFVNVITNHNLYWTLQPHSPLNFKIEVGKTYEVSFMAKAESPVSIGAAIRGQRTNTDFWSATAPLTTVPQTFGPFQFTCADNIATANTSFTIAFYVSTGQASDIWIDKVIVRDITPGGTPATGVTVSPSASTISLGQQVQITANVLPANALNEVTWSSSNTAVAVVNKSGLVSAISVGTAAITATSITGNYTASTNLTITAGGSSMVANGEFDAGTSPWTLDDWTAPGHAYNPRGFTVVSGAGLSGVNSANVDVQNTDNNSWTLQLNNALTTSLQNGKTYEISFMAKAESARDIQAVLRGAQTNTEFWKETVVLTTAPTTFGPYQFTCNDNNATLNTNFGIAFYLARGVEKDVWIDKVIVRDITTGFVSVTGVSVSPSRLSLSSGQTGQLNKKISPANASNAMVVWSSKDTNIATVNSDGVVTAVSSGITIITATSANGGFTAQATVEVNRGVTSYSTRLTGIEHHEYSLAKSLSVMPGDLIEIEVWAKYLDNNANNWTQALTSLMTQIAQGTAPTGTLVDDGVAGSIGGGQLPFTPTNHDSESGDAPKAYLNYIVFGKDINVPLDFGSRRITTAALESGEDGDHERLAFDGNEKIVIKEPGYVYIYLSNENDLPVKVYFDDFKVTHIKSPIIQSDDYYPFGLQFNHYQRENSVQNRYLFNGGSELQIDLNFGWYSTLFRIYDPAIGRFLQIDPLADFFSGITPYNFAENNPVLYGDPSGLSPNIWQRIKEFFGIGRFKGTKAAGNQEYVKPVARSKGKPVPYDFGLPQPPPTPTPQPAPVEATQQVAEQDEREDEPAVVYIPPGPIRKPKPKPGVLPQPKPQPKHDPEPDPLPFDVKPGGTRFNAYQFEIKKSDIYHTPQNDKLIRDLIIMLKVSSWQRRTFNQEQRIIKS